MNVKRFLLAALAVFVIFQVLDFVVHGLILSADYEATTQVWRPDMMEKMWIIYLTGLLLSLLFVYIFAKGYQGKGIMEGVRYGLVMGLLLAVVVNVNQYIVYPLPDGLLIKWILFGLIEIVVAGVAVSLIYKPK